MSENTKIAKNSLILYIRLIITTFVGLYISRILLTELGDDNYGLYAVVGGVVSMMGFLRSTLNTTTYRFVAVELGKGNKDKVNKIFNSSLTIFLLLGFLLVIIGETVGAWYVKTHLNIEAEKVNDALFVLHFVIASTFFSILIIPFQGLITAQENFLARASIETTRSLIHLGFVFFLIYYSGSKLRAYAIIMMIVNFLALSFFVFYSKWKYKKIVNWKINKDIKLYKEMLSFSVWMILGSFARMAERQGGAIIINLFFGTVLNAAFGLASRIYNYMMTFVRNISQAAMPQIMKNHGAGNNRRSVNLVHAISKYSYFILFLVATPVALLIDPILELWLDDVPQYTKAFAILMLVNGLVSVTGNGFGGAIQATGKIRLNQILSSIIILLTLPLTYMFFSMGYPPYFITVVIIGISFVIRMIRAWLLSTLIKEFNLKDDFKKVLLPVMIVTTTVFPLYYLRQYFGDALQSIIIFTCISLIWTLITIYFLGFNGNERKTIKRFTLKK
ncbi:MAG: MATE family efflux transporter [Bacteroidales bacterium]